MEKFWKNFINWITGRNSNFVTGNGFVPVNSDPSNGSIDPFTSFMNKYTDAGVSQRDVELNEMSMQNVEDNYQRQVTGMQKAGLNPAMMYSGGSSSAPSASSASTGADFASLVNLALLPAQIENMKANTAKTREETATNVTLRDKTVQETENLKQQLKNLVADEKLSVARRNEIQKALEWADRLNTAALQLEESQARLSDSQRKEIDTLLDGQKILQAKSIEDFEHRWSEIEAKIKQMAAVTQLTYEDIANYALNHMQTGFMGTGLSLPNLIRGFFGIKDDLISDSPAQGKPSSDPGHGYNAYTSKDFQDAPYGKGLLFHRKK